MIVHGPGRRRRAAGQLPDESTVLIIGVNRHSLRKMIGLAIDGVTSFWCHFRWDHDGGLMAPLGGVRALGGGRSRLAYTLLPMLFLGGMQLPSIGVLGEYVGKIYLETKGRPRFLVQETTTTSLFPEGSAADVATRQFAVLIP
jgi:hypothetical protein